MTPLLFLLNFLFRYITMTVHKTKISLDTYLYLRTNLPIYSLVVTHLTDGSISLDFESVEFTKRRAARLLLKNSDFSEKEHTEAIFCSRAQYAMLEYVRKLGECKYEAMIVHPGGFIPIRFGAQEVTLEMDSPDGSDEEVQSTLEHYVNGGWVQVFANTLPYWPESHYTRPRLIHANWCWSYMANLDSQHPYPHVDRPLSLVRLSPDPDTLGEVEVEITRRDWEDAVAMRKIRESIGVGYSRYRAPTGEYGTVTWLGQYGVFDLHRHGLYLIASTVDDTGTTIFESQPLGTRNPFAPEWYWEALLRLTSIDKNAANYFNLRTAKN